MDGENSERGGSWFVSITGGGTMAKNMMLICWWLPINVREEMLVYGFASSGAMWLSSLWKPPELVSGSGTLRNRSGDRS